MIALPLVKAHCGLRLPPDRHCLLAANYKLRAAEIQPKKLTKSALDRGNIKNKSTGAATLKRQNMTAMSKTQTVTIPKPVFKFTGNGKSTSSSGSAGASSSSKPQTVQNPPRFPHEVKMEMEDDYNSDEFQSVKRKREEDEFDVVE